MAAEAHMVRLECVKEGPRLRVRIISAGYSPAANCQISKAIRVAGREYLVPRENIKLGNTQGAYFYRVSVRGLLICLDKLAGAAAELKVYRDESANDCAVCMETFGDGARALVIFAPCGHASCCQGCASQLADCPICRAKVARLVAPDELQ